jgi:hypothetical protein
MAMSKGGRRTLSCRIRGWCTTVTLGSRVACYWPVHRAACLGRVARALVGPGAAALRRALASPGTALRIVYRR